MKNITLIHIYSGVCLKSKFLMLTYIQTRNVKYIYYEHKISLNNTWNAKSHFLAMLQVGFFFGF